MKRTFTIFIFTVLSIAMFAQGRLVTGTVRDANGNSLPGVTVQSVGTSTVTITDIDGFYQITVTKDTLKFSFIGYLTQTISVGDRKMIDIVLQDETAQLDEVVVIGYGTQKKKDITTAVSVVDEKAIAERPIVTAAQALQGQAAGVQVTSPSGKPGVQLAVRVRGSTSVLAGNEPLYVIDGVPTTNTAGINPSDIETMTVLKDASSSAIYGARAANGVVLITTKHGKENQSLISFNMYAGFSRLRKNIPVLNTKQYRDLMSDIGIALDPSWTDFGVWSDSVFGTGVNQNYQLALSGGNDKSKYYFSAGYLTQAGMVEPAQFDRLSVRLNMDNQIKPWLKFGTNLTMNRMTTKDTPDNLSSGRGGVFMSTLNTPPFLSIWDPENPGQYDPNPFQPSWENPVAYMQGADQKASDNIFLGDVYLNFKLYEGLNFQTKFGAEVNAHQWDYYLDPFQTNYGRNNNGIGQSDKRNSTTWLWENVVDYAKNWGEHHFTAMAGGSMQKYYTNDSYIYGTDFPSDVSVKTLNAANVVTASTTAEEWSLASIFARGTYDYNSKYYLTVTFREDGSSKLFDHWGFMPSFSAGWRISSENFMKDVKWIDDLKLRGGWGKNGNQEGIAPYAAYGLTEYYRQTPTNPLSGPATVTVSFGNPDLRWETTSQTDLGLDLSVLNYRLTFTFDAYYKKTSDVLLNVQLPTTYSPNTIQTNSGEITNKGLEFTINSVNINRDVVWTTNLNMALNRNEVTDLGPYTQVYFFGPIYSNNSDVSIMKVGLPLGSFYGYVADGVNPETGDLNYKDLNGNGIFDTGDRTVIGDPNPDFIFGFTNDLTYRRWDLNIFFQGSVGNDIYNATRIDLEGMFDSKNQSTAVLNRWTPDNPYTDMPRAIGGGNTNNVRNSTRFIENGSYVRLKTITLSYKILDHNPNFKAIQQLSVYCTGENLLTFTGYSGYDPEVSAYGVSSTEAGIDYGTYPQSINVIFGLNVQF